MFVKPIGENLHVVTHFLPAVVLAFANYQLEGRTCLLAAFLENLQSTFRLTVDASDCVELTLVEVSERKLAKRQEIFSIEFLCRSTGVMPQRIYHVEHEHMGQFDLFLVPVRKDEQGVYYEAVFNRLFKDSEGSG